MTNSEIRSIIRARAAEQAAKYKITSSDEVHFYGRMPNTDQAGWYFVGYGAEAVAKDILTGKI